MKNDNTILTYASLKSVLAGLMMLFLLGINLQSSAQQTYTVTSNTLWSALSPTPTVADTIYVKNNATVTVDVTNALCNMLKLGDNGTNPGHGTILMNSGSTLTVMGTSGEIQLGLASGYDGTLDMTSGGTIIFKDINEIAGDAILIRGTGTMIAKPTGSISLPIVLQDYYNLIQDSSGTTNLSNDITVTGTLTIISGTLDADGNNIDLSGNWNHTGTFTPGTGTVVFVGPSPQSIATIQTFYGLQINNSNDLTLNVNVTVTDQLTLSTGDVILGTYNLIIDDDGSSSGGSSSSYVQADNSGVLQKNFSSVDDFTFEVGDATNYSPFDLTMNSATLGGSDYLSVNVTDAKHPGILPGDHITRYWTLNYGGFSAIDYDLDYRYIDVDVVGTEANLITSRTNGVNWFQYDATNVGGNILTSSVGIAVLPSGHDFTAGSPGALPITLKSFEVKGIEGGVQIEWVTKSELNNDYFTVEKSTDGIGFEALATIKGAGTSYSENSYILIDPQPLNGISYYRLKQTNFDGMSETFPMVTFRKINTTEFTVYPNPNNGQDINLAINDAGEKEILVVLYNIMGEQIYSKVVVLNNGSVITAIDSDQQLAKGVYLVVGSSDESIYQKKLVIE